MHAEEKTRICPVERAGRLDHSFRRLLQNPKKILKPYVSEGMTVLDLGCGPGFFSLELASIVSDSGKVIAVDIQEGMLEKVRQKIAGTELARRIELHRCRETCVGITDKVDLVLAFYVIHEVPDQVKLFEELKFILKRNGKIYIAEPKHRVSKEAFENMIERITTIELEIIKRPKICFSRAVVFENRNNDQISF